MGAATDDPEPTYLERFLNALDKAAPLIAQNDAFAARIEEIVSELGVGPAFGPSTATSEIGGSAGSHDAGEFMKALHEEAFAARVQANSAARAEADHVANVLKAEEAQNRASAHAEAEQARRPNEAWDQASLTRYYEYANFTRDRAPER